MDYFEELPDGCPSEKALNTELRQLFRLCVGDDDKDFTSWRRQNANKGLPRGTTECIARSVSTQDTPEGLNHLKLLPRFKKKKTFVVALNLEEGDGPILATRGKGHYSWWRTKSYDLARCNTLP